MGLGRRGRTRGSMGASSQVGAPSRALRRFIELLAFGDTPIHSSHERTFSGADRRRKDAGSATTAPLVLEVPQVHFLLVENCAQDEARASCRAHSWWTSPLHTDPGSPNYDLASRADAARGPLPLDRFARHSCRQLSGRSDPMGLVVFGVTEVEGVQVQREKYAAHAVWTTLDAVHALLESDLRPWDEASRYDAHRIHAIAEFVDGLRDSEAVLVEPQALNDLQSTSSRSTTRSLPTSLTLRPIRHISLPPHRTSRTFFRSEGRTSSSTFPATPVAPSRLLRLGIRTPSTPRWTA